MVAAKQNPALPEPSGQKADDSYMENQPSDWTCYSAGKPTTDSVMQAAGSSSTSSDVLNMLAESCNVDVRMAVADNPSALLETVLMLAQDVSAELRFQLAENHNIDESMLQLLAEDSNPYVKHRAQRTLARLAGGASVSVLVVPKHRPNIGIARFVTETAVESKRKRQSF